MARKSMIEPTLPRGPETASEGILGRIIAHDRQQSGRTAPETQEQEIAENEEPNVTTLQRSHEEINEATNGTKEPPNEIPPVLSRPRAAIGVRAGSTAGQPETGKPADRAADDQAVGRPAQDDLEERQAAALLRAQEDDIAVVTVRAPQKLNAYIDRYVERVNRISPKRRYRKQDAVAEMFAWFYASHPMPPAPDEEDL